MKKIKKTRYAFFFTSGKKYFATFTCSLLITLLTKAQIMNIDRVIKQDSTNKKFHYIGSMYLTMDKQKKALVDFNFASELDRYLKNRYVLVMMMKADATYNGNQSLQNDGFVHLRYRDNDTRKLSPETFFQYQWNGTWGMEYRTLAGANMRFRWFEKKKVDMNTGLGLFHEWERWNWTGVKPEDIPPSAGKVKTSTWRLNNYWKVSGKISPIVDVAVVTFFQFPLNEKFLQPRWFVYANAYIKTGKHFSIVFHWNHIFDAGTAVPIPSFFYNFSTGVQVNL